MRVAAPGDLGPALDRLGQARAKVLLEASSAAAWLAQRLVAAGGEVVRGADPCALPKACKNAVELAGARAAHRRDGAALCGFLAWLAREAPGGKLTEVTAADRLDAFRAEQPLFREPSFPTISGAGPNGAIVHYRATPATDRALGPGMLYLVDSGGQYPDGTTDVTRTVAIGPPTAEQRDRFTRVLRGHIDLAMARFPVGTTGAQLDTLARAPVWEAALDYDHGTGHGVGSYLGVHEGPQSVSKRASTVALKPGMIVSNEPGYYKTGEYGIRIESLVVVVECGRPPGGEQDLLGFETLTPAPIDLALVEPAGLTGAQRAWLDAYHAWVRETITPLVDAETAAWLAQATRPVGYGLHPAAGSARARPVEDESGDIPEIRRVPGPDAGLVAQRAGRDREVELPVAGPRHGAVEPRGDRRFPRSERHRFIVREQLSLVLQLRLAPRSAKPLVEDQRRDRDPLPLLDDVPEVACQAPRPGERVDEQ